MVHKRMLSCWRDLQQEPGKSYFTAFAICTGNGTTLILSNACLDLIEVTGAAGVIEVPFSRRLFPTEKMRRMMSYVLTFPDHANARPGCLSSVAENNSVTRLCFEAGGSVLQ